MKEFIPENLPPIANRLKNEYLIRLLAWQQRGDPLHYQKGRKPLNGILRINTDNIKFDYDSPAVSWKKGDPYLDITVPPLFRSTLTRERGDEGLHQLARYIAVNGLQTHEELKVVGSVTHRVFGAMAVRAFGFSIAKVDPEVFSIHEAEAAVRIAQEFGGEYTAANAAPVFAFRPIEDLLTHYALQDIELAEWVANPPKVEELIL